MNIFRAGLAGPSPPVQTQRMKSILPWLAVGLIVTGCSSTRAVDHDYHDEIARHPELAKSPETSIVILVDGLSRELLATAMQEKLVPHIQTFFNVQGIEFAVARASFPSLTFPNLTSILTASPVDVHGVFGNRIPTVDGVVDFQDISSWSELYSKVKTKTVFDRLTERRQTAANFSFPFSDAGGTTVDQQAGLDNAIDYLERDYAAIDLKTLQSVDVLLQQNPPAHWPRFIFIHLIGVDALEHDRGPNDKSVGDYLAELDRSLRTLFGAVRAAENAGHPVATVLTADHGFASIERDIALDNVAAIDGVRVIADNRVAPIWVHEMRSEEKRQEWINRLLRTPHLGWLFEKRGMTVHMYDAGGEKAAIELQPGHCSTSSWMARVRLTAKDVRVTPATAEQQFFCADAFDRGTNLGKNNMSFMIPAVADYFYGPHSPDFLLIADEHSEFSGQYRGNHGGLTSGEMLVPLLSHGVVLPKQVFPTWQLLNHLKLM